MIISLSLGSYLVDNLLGPVYITGIDGFDNPDPSLTTYKIPYDDGSEFISQRYQSRKIALKGIITGSTITAYAANRQAMYQAFSFDNEQKTLTITNDIGQTFVTTVTIASRLATAPKAGQVTACEFDVSLLAVDGLLYSSAAHVASGGVTTTSAGTAIPTAIPINLSSSFSSNVITATNAGTATVYPTQIKIIGPGTNFTITNRTTGQAIQLDTTLTSSQYAIIDPKRQTATRSDGANLYQYLTIDRFKLIQGSNIITLAVGSGSTIDTLLEITSRDAYHGI